MHFKASVGRCGSCRSRTHSNSTKKTAADPFLAGGLVAVACLALIVTGAWHEWSARSVDLRNAEIEKANLAKSLIQHADDTFEITEIVLDGVVAALEQNGTSPESLTRLQKFLQLRKSVGRIRGLFVFDRDGTWLATTETEDRSRFNNGDRDYFWTHARHASRQTLIGKPVKSKVSNEWIVPVSRRFAAQTAASEASHRRRSRPDTFRGTLRSSISVLTAPYRF